VILRGSTAASFPVMFASGHPDADVSWTLFGPAGTIIRSGTVPVSADAVSVALRTTALDNGLGSELHSYRDLVWTYDVGGVTVNGEIRYLIEARLPIGVSADGVRRKLGVEATDLPDSDISLVKAYLNFMSMVAMTALPDTLTVVDAVEAQAALEVLPTMTVRVAAQEESGTDKYKRQDIDWSAIADGLNSLVDAGVLDLLPVYDPTAGFGSLLILAGPTTDAYTGA